MAQSSYNPLICELCSHPLSPKTLSSHESRSCCNHSHQAILENSSKKTFYECPFYGTCKYGLCPECFSQNSSSRIPILPSIFSLCRMGEVEEVRSRLLSGEDPNQTNWKGKTLLHVAAYKNLVLLLLEKGANIEAIDKSHHTPFHDACSQGRKEVATLLIEKGANIDAKDENNNTPFHIACKRDRKEVVSLLIEKGANIEAMNKYDFTPLHVACTRGHKEVATLLIEKGANIEAKDNDNKTPLRIACYSGHKEVVSLLLEKGANIETKDKFERTPLHDACYQGHKVVVNLLIEKGANIEANNKFDKTPFLIACSQGHLEVVCLLIEKGANMEVKDKNRNTPFHFSCLMGHKEVVSLLIEKGANMEAKRKDNKTPLFDACSQGHKEAASLLIEKGANIEAKDNFSNTPLHIACYEGHLEVVRLLIEKGANIETKDNFKNTPLHIACSKGHEEVVSLLIEKGANIEAKDKFNNTPLQIACYYGHKEVISLLIEKGANIEAKGKDGFTSLNIACKIGDKELVLFLLNHNARFEPEPQKNLPRQSALKVTCESENYSDSILSILLARGADPSIMLKHASDLNENMVQLLQDKESAFFLGCELFGEEAYDLHVSRGADPTAINKDGHSPLMIAITHGNLPLIQHLILTLKHELPFQVGDENINILLFAKHKNRPESRAWLWNHIVQDVKYIDLVRQSLLADPSVYSVLDQYERLISTLAVPKVKEVMDDVLLWFGRYRLLEDRPEHQSATCFVFKAEDQRLKDESGAKKRVALKLMLRKDQFLREVEMRSLLNFEDAHVISVLTQHPSELSEIASRQDEIFLDPFQLVEGVPTKSLAESMFAISLPLADRNLFVALKQERFAGKDWNMVKFILKDLVEAVDHVHSKGVIHADLKPLNLVRVDGDWKLIDFDACCRIGVDHTGLKSSSAFCPPESIYVDRSVSPALACVRSEEGRKANGLEYVEYDLLLAHPSFDVWGLGCICYMLCTDCRMLFQGGQDDNLKADESADSLFHLEEWSDALKTQKLSLVEDPLARNLLSLMLMKDPTKRPSLARILEHPFLTGKSVSRLVGDKPEFDVFLSYRVASDAEHVGQLYNLLTAEDLKVWWDTKELKDGENWETGFCNGLVNSRIFVPFLSREGLARFSGLTESSPCDNMLLEHRLALELKEMGLIEHVFPIVMGDLAVGSEQSMFKIDWSTIFPVCPDVCVSSVEEGTCHHLHNEALGSPLQPNRSVLSVMTEMRKMQGALIDGEYESQMRKASKRIIATASPVPSTHIAITTSLSPSECASKIQTVLSSMNNFLSELPPDLLTQSLSELKLFNEKLYNSYHHHF